jgi:hypothetical protein
MSSEGLDNDAASHPRQLAERAALCGVRLDYHAVPWGRTGPRVAADASRGLPEPRPVNGVYHRTYPGQGVLDVEGWIGNGPA